MNELWKIHLNPISVDSYPVAIYLFLGCEKIGVRLRRAKTHGNLRPFHFFTFETKIAARNGKRSSSILCTENNGLKQTINKLED